MGLSVGATNLVAARADGRATVRPSAVTWRDWVLTGFVERFGDPVPILAADGSAHAADRLTVAALADLGRTFGRAEVTCVAVPAHWQTHLLDGMRALLPDATVTTDAVAALTALRTRPGLPARGVVALCDFGATGTTITLADAGADFRTIGESIRSEVFAGDLIDRAVLAHLLSGLDADPARTSAVAALAEFRDRARTAKERLSFQTVTGLPGPRPGTTVRLTRAELESLMREPMDGVLAVFDDAIQRSGVRRSDLAAVATVGGGARIPFVTQRLSEVFRLPVTTTADAQTAAAIGAALLGGREPETATRLAVAPQTATMLAPVVAPMAWSQSDVDEISLGDDPALARPEIVFDDDASDEVEALPPLPWYQRPALLFAAAACAAMFAAVGLVVSTDTEPANASSPVPTIAATPSMSDARVPVTADAAAPPVVTETLVEAGRPTVVRYSPAPPARRAPAPQAPAPAAPAPQAPPPAPVTTPTTTTTAPTTTPTTTTTTPTTTTTTPPTSTSTSTSAPPPPPPSSSSAEPPPSSSAPPPSSPPPSATATVVPEANPPASP